MADRCEPRDFVRLESFADELLAASRSQNLISRATMPLMWIRHIADSAQLLDHVPREATGDWLDLGSGAGFPGLVIAIMRPDLFVKLLESRNLRVEWLRSAVHNLGITNCDVLACDVRKAPPVVARVISARAFAPLDRLVALSARFSTSDTHWVLPKGRSAAQEVARLPTNQRRMFHVEQSATDENAGIVVGTGKVELLG